MSEAFVIEGNLWLCSQEGGFAADAFEVDDKDLDDIVADHFGAARKGLPANAYARENWGVKWEHVGDRHIGNVRITIERLSDE